MNRKFLKKFMSRAGWRISDARLFMEHIADPAAHDPNLPELTLLNLVRQALLALRHNNGWQTDTEHEEEMGRGVFPQRQSSSREKEGEESNPAFRWDHPWAELRYPVEWDWSSADATLESPFKMPASPREDRLDWLIKTTHRQQELLIFEVLTHGAARRRRAGRDFVIPNPHHSDLINEALQDIPAEQHEKWIEEYLDLLLKPFTVGLMDDFEDEKPDHIVRRLENVPAVRFALEDGIEGIVVLQVHPLVVDEAERRAYYPVVTGLSLWPRGTVPSPVPQEVEKLLRSTPPDAVRAWSPAQCEAHWNRVLMALDAAEAAFRSNPEDDVDYRGEYAPLTLPTPEVLALTEQSRYLLEGPTRFDRRAATLVAYAHGLNLPRKWTTIRAWHQMEAQEIERLQREHGAEAFEASEKGRGKRPRGALLQRRVRPSGESVIDLSEEASHALAERESLRGFRRLLRDDDGVQREYLIKRLRTPSGHLEIRLSWYGMAWPLVSDAVEYQQSSLRALDMRSSLGNPSLFEELEEQRRADLNGQLRQMESIRDARLVMDLILRSFGRDGENPLHIPAWQLRALLECENDDNGFRRVEGCLRALQEVRFHVQTDNNGPGATAESFGPFIGDVKYIGRGQGRHTDGDYYLQVSPGTIGCLQVFSTGQYQAANTERVLLYDWKKKLSQENRDNLTGYARGFLTLAPYYDRAKGFTPTQSNLLRWIEHEITLNRDAVRKTHKAKRVANGDARAEEPRLYGHDFCPLLPQDLHFYGALGHFARNPETGRKLQRSERGASTPNESLLAVMGQILPSKRARVERNKMLMQALQDMRAVVEEALGGHAVAWQPQQSAGPSSGQGRWLSLQDAATLPEKELLQEIPWFMFIAPDFRSRLAADLEKYHAERYEHGKTPYPIKVTQSREEAHKGHLQTAGEHYESVDDSQSIRARLKARRAEKGLSQAKVADIFGVSQKTIDYWEKGPLADESGRVRGKPIPREVLPFVLRWIDNGQAPTGDELAARTTRRAGVRRK